MWNRNNIENFHNLLTKEINRAANETLDNFSAGVKKNINNTNEFDGSDVKHSVQVKNISDGSTFTSSISIDGKIAEILEKGSKPHKIRAKEGSLKFDVNGKTIYTKEVDHPGTAPTHFFSEACDKESKNIEKDMIEKMIEISKKG